MGSQGAVAERTPVESKLRAGVAQYSRDSEFLVKRARSRNSRASYEHKASLDIVTTVGEALSEWRSSKKLISADLLLEACRRKKTNVVAYQVYVVVGWLVDIKLIRRHGRSGYSVPKPIEIIESVQRAWTKLPSA
jgi:hypothetical protein